MTTLNEFVDRQPYTPEQKTLLRLYCERKKNMLPTSSYSDAELLGALGPQLRHNRRILFIGFEDRAVVDDIGAALDFAIEMVDTGLRNVGLYNTWSSSNYEIIFGKHTSRSGDSYQLRARKVQSTLNDIRVRAGTDPWVMTFTGERKVASWSSGSKIDVGTRFLDARGKFAAGILIHEIGHRVGLEDICAECHDAALKLAHFQGRPPGKCSEDNDHGKLAPADKGHFISLKRCKTLATLQKNLTVHNADSYRWYCSYFFKDAINVGAQAMGIPQPPW